MDFRIWLAIASSVALAACATKLAPHEAPASSKPVVPVASPMPVASPVPIASEPLEPPHAAASEHEQVEAGTAAPEPPSPPPAEPKPLRTKPTRPASVDRSVQKTPSSPPAPAITTSTLFGHVFVVGSAGGEDTARTVVYFTPDGAVPRPKPGEFRIYTHRRAFDPPSLVIPLGSRVIFPNQDDILHNVFSATPGSEFDLGTYAEDERASYTFKKAGVIVVNCNVHQEMQANILVLATPYYTNADANGDFHIPDVPAGRGTLTAWHPRAATRVQVLHAPSLEPIALELSLSKPAVSAHLNKEHKQYHTPAKP